MHDAVTHGVKVRKRRDARDLGAFRYDPAQDVVDGIAMIAQGHGLLEGGLPLGLGR